MPDGAGALSIAAGEYVSVSSQTDIEHADIEREKIELAKMPEQELQILAEIYERRGSGGVVGLFIY